MPLVRDVPITDEDRAAGLIACADLDSLAPYTKPLFIRLHLWGSRDAMRAALATDSEAEFHANSDLLTAKGGINGAVDHLGNVHLCADALTVELVAHEISHAMMARNAVVESNLGSEALELVGEQWIGGNIDEERAYEFGHWTHRAYHWAQLNAPTVAENKVRRGLARWHAEHPSQG